MIELSKTDIRWIKLFKLHYKEQYSYKGQWVDVMKPMFEENYGWNADEHYDDYLNCMFGRLLELWIKVQDDQSGSNVQMREIFSAAFRKSFDNESDLPIERSINRICGLIQNNKVKGRYILDEK